MNSFPKIFAGILAAALLASANTAFAAVADAEAAAGMPAGPAHGFPGPPGPPGDGNGVTQRGCMSLSDAVESIRRRGNVERIISAETQVSNGREVHVVKVLTTDGKVRTHRVPGCRRD